MIKQCYRIAWSSEKTEKVKIQCREKNEMKLIVFSKCAVCDRKFIGKQEKSRLLSN